MSRRRLGLGMGIGIAVLAILLLWWRGGDDRASGGAAASKVASARDAHGRASTMIDVATVARGSIDGRVLDPAGTGVASARVCGYAYSDELPADETRDPFCTIAGPDGRYRLERLLPARYELHAHAPRFAPGRHRTDDDRGLRLAAGEARSGVDITLAAGGVEVAGVVKDIGGGPVGGAWVYLRSGVIWSESVAMATVQSEADGSFRAWVAPGRVHASAEADGYAEGETDAVAPGQLVEILLTPESVLAGRVVEKATGAPVPGATVRVGGSWRDGDGATAARATTDADGRFRLARLSPGRYKPAAVAPGRQGQAAESVRLGLGETVEDVVIEVYPASVITGRVVLEDGTTPCTGGDVGLTDAEAANEHGAQIEEDGGVRIDAALAGRYQVEVRCEGRLPAKDVAELVVTEGVDPPEQVWKAGATGSRLRGVVLAHDGRPLGDARVEAEPVPDTVGDGWGGATTAADGTFEVTALRAGTYKVSAQAAGAPASQEPVRVDVPEGGEASVELRLPEGGAIAGTVRDEHGTPVARARVMAMGSARRWSSSNRTQTLDDGSFRTGGLAPGSYRVVVTPDATWGSPLRAPGKTDDDEGVKVEVRAGETARLDLVVESRAGVIRGRVVDSKGAPVTDAFVDAVRESDSAAAAEGRARRLMRWSWGRRPILTDTSGAFTIDTLSPGSYTVRAFRRGGGEAVVEHVAIGVDVTITIHDTGSIAGAVTLEGGGAPERLAIEVRGKKSGYRRTEQFFRTGGAFAMRDLPADDYVVAASAAQGTATAPVTLAEGQAVRGLAIRLGARARVTGRVVAADDGKPLAGFTVLVSSIEGSDGFRIDFGPDMPLTRADGRFDLPNVPTGRVRLVAYPMGSDGDYAFAYKLLTLDGGKSTDVGDIRVARSRVKDGERAGDLGFLLKEIGYDVDPAAAALAVAIVRADGPAAKAGLKVGDVIVSVDGNDVTGDPFSYRTYTTVPPGTTVTLGLAGGRTVAITAGPPR